MMVNRILEQEVPVKNEIPVSFVPRIFTGSLDEMKLIARWAGRGV
jgi:hypothetical protein